MSQTFQVRIYYWQNMITQSINRMTELNVRRFVSNQLVEDFLSCKDKLALIEAENMILKQIPKLKIV